MKIGICAKVTPDTDSRIKVQGDGIDTAGIKWVVSPYDLFAVEEAIQTKEALGGAVEEIIGYSVGPESVVTQLRQSCLALGADKAVIVHGDAAENTDALGVARCLAKAIERDGADLVFCGKVAADDDNTQVPSMLAEVLGWSLISRIVSFETAGETVTAAQPRRRRSRGRHRQASDDPHRRPRPQYATPNCLPLRPNVSRLTT